MVKKPVYSSRAAPSVEPLTVADVTGPLRIDYSEDDTELSHLITEARQWAEDNQLGRVLVNRTVTEYFNGFGGDLELRWPTVQSVTSVEYVDSDGATQTLSTDTYELGHHLGIGRIRLQYNQTWPTTRDQEDSVTVTYVAGYGTAAADVPRAIRQALILYVNYRYDGSIDDQLLASARRLLGPYSARR